MKFPAFPWQVCNCNFDPNEKQMGLCNQWFLSILLLLLRSQQWVRQSPQCLNWSPKLPVGIHQTGPCLASQNVVVGQDCRMWLAVWGPVPHGHSSEWEISRLWRWERSWQCPVLSLKIVTWAALSGWWMLCPSVPMSRHCHHSLLKLFHSCPFNCLISCCLYTYPSILLGINFEHLSLRTSF